MRVPWAALAVSLLPRPAEAGAWTQPPGQLWLKASLIRLDSDAVFADADDVFLTGCSASIEVGDRRPFDCATGGRFGVTALYLDAILGLAEGLDLGLQVPWIAETTFVNRSGLSGEDAGLGDVRLSLRYAWARTGPGRSGLPAWRGAPITGALHVELKAPTGNFSVDESVPPLGEGQWDLSTRVAVGWAHPRFYLGGQAGFRWRATNPSTSVDVGDELVALAEGGVHVFGWLSLPLKTDLVFGAESFETGVPNPRPGRWIWRLIPGIVFRWPDTRWGLELTSFVPLAGAGYPANPSFAAAVVGGLDLWTSSAR